MYHAAASGPGELPNQNTFILGHTQGRRESVGAGRGRRVLLAFATVYISKMPITAADTLYERVLPFYEASVSPSVLR